MSVTAERSLNPSTGEGADQVQFNTEIKKYINAINGNGANVAEVDELTRLNVDQNSAFTGYSIDMDLGRRQYIGITTSGQNCPITFPASSALEVGDQLILFYELKDASYTSSTVLQGSQTVNGSASNLTLTNVYDYVVLLYIATDTFVKIGGNI